MKNSKKHTQKIRKQIIGLISGTSSDGIDAALVDIEAQGHERKVDLKAFETYAYPKKIRSKILELAHAEKIILDELCSFQIILGDLFGDAALAIAKKAKVPLSQIDLIGSHGQTIRHLPPTASFNRGMSFQIAEAAMIVCKTKVTTVSDFRVNDMAWGGHGAPLTPYLHYYLFHQVGYGVAIQNIGGMSNVTVIPSNASLKDVVAFDTGPGNALIDAMVSHATRGKKQFDADGAMAAKGKVQTLFLNKLLKHPFFFKKPPKSTGREEFGVVFAKHILSLAKGMSMEDLIATVTALTAHSISENYFRFVFPKTKIREIILGGGGAKNKTLVHFLKRCMPMISHKRFEDYGYNSSAIEAMAFALLAFETSQGTCANLPEVTGAQREVVLGKVTPGANFRSICLK
ncbi:MAG: anhydro-N-acetylmuramic acid kinase [Deltaproteobacteria bacterium]|nr:anhydro-N-acetylmuramic acid kinase [Deltaproteobacteria bacterium]